MDSDEKATLKTKRGCRCANLSKLKNSLLKFVDKPLEELSLRALQRQLSAAEENIKAFDTLNQQIDIFIGQSSEESEEMERVRESYDVLRDDCCDLVEAKRAYLEYAALEEVDGRLSAMPSLTTATPARLLEEMRTRLDAIRTIQLQQPKHRQLLQLVVDAGRKVDAQSRLMDREMEDLRSRDRATATPTDRVPTRTVPAMSPHARMHLETTKFSGNILEWKDFWKLFSSVIEKDHTLTDVDKICYLSRAMEDEEAKAIVTHTAGTTDSYDEVVEALKERYDRCKVVYAHHMDSFHHLELMDYTRKSLRQSLEKGREVLRGWERNKGSSPEQILVGRMELTMTERCKREWGIYSAKTREPPNFKLLSEFICERMETLPEDPHPRKPPRPVTNSKNTSQTESNRRGAVLQVGGKVVEECCVCKDRHFLHQCNGFKALSLDAKVDTVKRAKLCFNCLKPGHQSRACTSDYTCRECSKRHHTLLHKKETRVVNTVDASNNAALVTSVGRINPEPVVIPRTVLTTVLSGPYQRKARAQLDPGATISLVTSRLVQSLKCKLIPCHTEISGIGGDTRSTHQAKLELSSAISTGGETIKVLAHVVSRITDGYSPQDLTTVKQMPFLQGLPLADPEFDRSGRIDLLLGISACNECSLDEVVSSPNRRFKAMKTIFGWALAVRDLQHKHHNCTHVVG